MSRTERRNGVTVRTRILAATLLVVAIALCAIVFTTGRSLFARIDAATVTELEHEAEKLRAFAADVDPTTGSPFRDVRTLLTSHLAHNVSEQDETLFSIIGTRADRRSPGEPPARLDHDVDFIADIADADSPRSGHMDTSAGPVAYAALPVRVEGNSTSGVLVIVEFLGPAYDEAWSTVVIMSGAAVFALIIAGGAGWFVAGRALAPIRRVQETAAQIGESDLERRIEVSGTDDVVQLAETFNGMLDRLQTAFDGQQRFLDDAGHELRTPITIVRGHLELISDDPDERVQTLGLVDDELRRMSRLVDDLILLARSERPDFLVLGSVDLTDLVVETLSKATAIAGRAWSIDAVPEGIARADGQRLAQALLQLAVNAAAHTEPGEAIAIGGEIVGTRLHLWVRDDGSGIATSEQHRIFERFARGRDGRRKPGSGLGLAIVDRIAQAHGGTVKVASSPGQGALFTLNLPLRAPEESS